MPDPIPAFIHPLRAKDLIDRRDAEPLDIPRLAREAYASDAHFIRSFKRAFGETPHGYLLTRRLERAAAMLRTTDRAVAEIGLAVGWQSVGSFTSSFTRTYGKSPTAYRASYPPAAGYARVPSCLVRFHGRPQLSTFREDKSPAPE
jgi:transcriptional regulator GlxA family with amidase domain